MCSPTCLEALYGPASRRGFVKKSIMAAAAVACGARAASGAAMATPATQQPRSFTTVLDLTHTLYEGFPTFDGSKWFTKEKKFTFATDKLISTPGRWSSTPARTWMRRFILRPMDIAWTKVPSPTLSCR